MSSALITRLHEQGVPVIITSGSEMDFPPSVKMATILEKPFSELQLLAILYPLIAHKAALSGNMKNCPDDTRRDYAQGTLSS